ncbi:hypothetical protein ACOME3_003015 [Neoechinorhynchus agilis]
MFRLLLILVFVCSPHVYGDGPIKLIDGSDLRNLNWKGSKAIKVSSCSTERLGMKARVNQKVHRPLVSWYKLVRGPYKGGALGVHDLIASCGLQYFFQRDYFDGRIKHGNCLTRLGMNLEKDFEKVYLLIANSTYERRGASLNQESSEISELDLDRTLYAQDAVYFAVEHVPVKSRTFLLNIFYVSCKFKLPPKYSSSLISTMCARLLTMTMILIWIV